MKRTASALTLILALLTLVVTGAQFMEFGRANAVQVQTLQSSELKQQFDFDVVYAYVQGGSNRLVYNITCVSDLPPSSEAIIEVYRIEIFSDGHLVGSGAVHLDIGPVPMELLMDLVMSLHSLRGYGVYGLQTGSIPFQPDFNADLGTVSLSVRRLGWITIDGDSVHSTLSSLSSGELIKQVQLEEFGNGFLYNVLVPTEQLSQIDLFRPLNSSNPNSPSPSPSPSQKPTLSPEPQNPEPFPTTLAIASVVVMTVIGISLVVCFVKFKKR